jgi:antitoxin (DNA-binding transcriptional repressor) of toxin-antitoxin stability system
VKTLAIEKTDLDDCVTAAKAGQVVVTRKGKPVALLVNLQGLDKEQVELGISDEFWKLIGMRRKEDQISRSELEARLHTNGKPKMRSRKKP